MSPKRWYVAILVLAVAVAVTARVGAYPDYTRDTKVACEGCHANPAGGPALTDAGKAYKADKTAPKGPAEGATYAGSNKCRMCHLKEYKAWQQTAHAHAMATLKSGDEKAIAAMATALKVELKGSAAEAPECVQCHVTGYQIAGGYPAADSSKTAAVTNVTCEACHGPGSKHIAASRDEKKNFINHDVTAVTCVQCHTSTTSPKFEAESADYMKRGVHMVAKSGD